MGDQPSDKTQAEIRAKRQAKISEEVELMRQVASGDDRALEEIYRRYAGMLKALILRVVADYGEAEEILQEVFVQAWRQADRYNHQRASVSTWLALIARSRSIDRIRTRKVVARTAVSAQLEKGDEHQSPEGMTDVLTQERRKRLSQALNKLPQEQRTVLELAFYQGLTQREISERENIPLGTVKTRTLLAMNKLRRSLASEIEDLL